MCVCVCVCVFDLYVHVHFSCFSRLPVPTVMTSNLPIVGEAETIDINFVGSKEQVGIRFVRRPGSLRPVYELLEVGHHYEMDTTYDCLHLGG